MRVETRLQFDNTASTHSTVVEMVAQDAPGLLRAFACTVAALGCDIRVALIDTEGATAVDVFYLTVGGEKLTESMQGLLTKAVEGAIAALRSDAAVSGRVLAG